MKSSLRKLRGFALQRHEQRVDRHRDHSTAAKAADELLAAAQVRTLSFRRRLELRCASGRARREILRGRSAWGLEVWSRWARMREPPKPFSVPGGSGRRIARDAFRRSGCVGAVPGLP